MVPSKYSYLVIRITILIQLIGSQKLPIKWNAVFPSSGHVDNAIWMHNMDAN